MFKFYTYKNEMVIENANNIEEWGVALHLQSKEYQYYKLLELYIEEIRNHPFALDFDYTLDNCDYSDMFSLEKLKDNGIDVESIYKNFDKVEHYYRELLGNESYTVGQVDAAEKCAQTQKYLFDAIKELNGSQLNKLNYLFHRRMSHVVGDGKDDLFTRNQKRAFLAVCRVVGDHVTKIDQRVDYYTDVSIGQKIEDITDLEGYIDQLREQREKLVNDNMEMKYIEKDENKIALNNKKIENLANGIKEQSEIINQYRKQLSNRITENMQSDSKSIPRDTMEFLQSRKATLENQSVKEERYPGAAEKESKHYTDLLRFARNIEKEKQ